MNRSPTFLLDPGLGIILANRNAVGKLLMYLKQKSSVISDKAFNNLFKFSWVILGSTQIFSAGIKGLY